MVFMSMRLRAESGSAVLEQYTAEPDSARSRMLIETMEDILGGAGRIVVVDQNNTVLQHMDLGQQSTPDTAAIEGGK